MISGLQFVKVSTCFRTPFSSIYCLEKSPLVTMSPVSLHYKKLRDHLTNGIIRYLKIFVHQDKARIFTFHFNKGRWSDWIQ